jgi:hypothetical protein
MEKDSTGQQIKIKSVFISPDAKQKRGSAHTVQDQIGEVLCANGIPYPDLADDDRKGGARLCYNMLKSNLVIISSTCTELIECLPSLTHEDGNEEDVLKVEGDDAYDAWRYGLKSMLGGATKPVELQIEEKIASWKADQRLNDPTSEMVWRDVLKREALRAQQPVRFAYRRGPRRQG